MRSQESGLEAYTAKEHLGRYLFYDTRLSFNNSRSCASCHNPTLAYTDGYRTSTTADGSNLRRNAPSLLNVYENYFFDWANPQITSLELQIKRPLYSHSPTELGLTEDHAQKLKLIYSRDTLIHRLFSNAYPGNDNLLFTTSQIEECLVAYVKSLQSKNSIYDQFLQGSVRIISPNIVRGANLFRSVKYGCNSCHRIPDFTLASLYNSVDSVYRRYHSISGSQDDPGVMEVTRLDIHQYRFKIPSLRNVAITTPYLHDGSVNSLKEFVVEFCRSSNNEEVNYKIPSPEEQDDIIAFLQSLTDTSYLSNEHFKNPFRLTAK